MIPVGAIAAARHAGSVGGEGHTHWRLSGFVVSGGNLEVSEMGLYVGSTRQFPDTFTSSAVPEYGDLSTLQDGNLGSRCYWLDTTAEAGTFRVQFQFASPKAIDGVAFGGFDTSTRYPTNSVLSWSDDGTTWTTVGEVITTYPGNGVMPAPSTPIAPVTLLELHAASGFEDSSSYARTPSSTANASVNSGAIRILEDGHLEWSSLSLLADGVWTIEGKMKMEAMPSAVRAHLFGCWNNSEGWTVDLSQNGADLFLGRNGAGSYGGPGGTITAGTWFDMGFVLRITASAMTLQPFIGGTPGALISEQRPSTGTQFGFRLGNRSDGALDPDIWWDDVRVSSGIRRSL